MRFILTFTLVLAAACTPAPEPSLPFFGNGYRFTGDLCRRLGEDLFTARFLGHTADLVGCPQDADNLEVYVADTGARQVAHRDGYLIYSVPRN